MKKLALALLFALPIGHYGLAQNNNILTSRTYPQGYFRNPLNIAADASGLFGELRSTHFHAGDDYRTQQRIGLPLYAAAEGYISRIRQQIGGGGNSIYITHPNGFTSVYLHMDSFKDAITQTIRTEQYKQQRFDVDMEVKEGQIKVSKGQFIGNAGNTGGSAGPHLHLEIRDTKSQRPINPQLFGLKFNDRYAPTINGLMVYDIDDAIFNENTARRPQAIKALGSGRYGLSSSSPISVNGKFALGINAVDMTRAGGFRHGVYSIELYLDGKAISTVTFEELDFASSSSINSYIDFPYFKRNKVKIQKSFKDPGNNIQIYKHLDNNGIIELKDQEVHDIKYVLKDVHGNCSELNFQVKNNTSFQPKKTSINGKRFEYNKDNVFSNEEIKVEIPKGSLYTDLDFTYKSSVGNPTSYSKIHHVSNNLTPLFSTYKLSIKPTNLPANLESKAIIAAVEGGAVGGKFENGYVTVNTKQFGSFFIAVDTIAPRIVPRNLTNGKNLSAQSKIDFTISDEYSGIQSFNAFIDDKWVLMEYDSKNRHIWHKFESNLPKGQHKFKLIVKDWKDNEKVYEANFTR